MNRSELSKALAEGKPALQAKGVQHLALFGSYAHGDASLVDLAGVANLLTDITGIETHAIERKMIAKDPRFSERIAGDIIEIF